jgi:hypothetical protein
MRIHGKHGEIHKQKRGI